MTFEGKPSGPAMMGPETETEAFSGEKFLAEQGLESIADFDVEAHGIRIPLSRALEVCRPLAGMVESLSTSLKDVPGHTDIIKTALVSAASKAETQLSDEAKKKIENEVWPEPLRPNKTPGTAKIHVESMIPDTLKKQVAMPAGPSEVEHHVEANIPIIKENNVPSLAAEMHDHAQLHKVHHLSLGPDTATVPPHQTNAASESSNLIQFSTEGDTKQDDRPEVTHFESPFGHNEATPEQPFQLESIAVEIVGKATELKTETEATLGDEPEHINLPLNEPISPESRNLIIEAIEQQFTEIMNNPDNWSLENLQSSDEILHPGLVLSPEIKAYDATEFTDLLDEVFNQEDTSEESNASIPNTYVVPIVSREETGAFFTHLDIFIQERDIENAEEITDIFQETVTKIQDMLESATIDADALTVEIPALELESLLAACSEIVEYLGYASTEQNARRLLNRLIASVHTVQQLDLRNANNKVWLNTMGTYEHKFDNALSQLPGSIVVRELLHKAIGQYVLAKAQSA